MDAETRVKLVQVTDTHLYADPGDVLVGMNCEEGMQDVLALVRAEEGDLAAVLCTGDISQDNSGESYRRFEQAVAGLGVPQYWIAGNHDEVPRMRAAVGHDNPCFTRVVEIQGWTIIMLNSNVVGEVHGTLTTAELAFLEEQLGAARAPNVLVCLHHNCVPVKAAWLQVHALTNSEAFFAVLDRFPQVRAVVFGHIHHELVHERRQVLYLGAPSTCIQFHPDSAEFRLDDCNPGYRWFELYGNGELRTGIKRVSGKRYHVDFSGIGY